MKKGYWVIVFHSLKDPSKVDAYRALTGPILQDAQATFIIRGSPSKAYEKGRLERVVVVEFESLEKAIAVHDGASYQSALRVLGDGAERDLRIVEGA